MGKYWIALTLVACLAASGCTRSTNALSINTQSPPQPLPSQPAGSVQSGQLDPITQDRYNQQGQLVNPQTQWQDLQQPSDGQQVASLQQPQPDTGTPLKHEQLAGAWNVSPDGAGCRVFLSFTQWSGGYRAGSRSCASRELSAITAWDVKGSKVVLVDTNGAVVASLSSAGTEQYTGTTASGQPVTFSR